MRATLPPRLPSKSDKADRGKRSPAHRAWIRGHARSACGATAGIECAHVRIGTDGGMGIKPSDVWCISLCRDCHNEQHMLGEPSFEEKHGIDMKALAQAFYRASPHRSKLNG